MARGASWAASSCRARRRPPEGAAPQRIAPMESLATVLRRIPIFADLPPGGFAKIIADLREERVAAGTPVCIEGDPADDFFVVKSGILDVYVKHANGSPEPVSVIGAN